MIRCKRCGLKRDDTEFYTRKRGMHQAIYRWCKACCRLKRDNTESRACKGCGIVKVPEDFYHKADGYRQGACKECCRKKQTAYNRALLIADPLYNKRENVRKAAQKSRLKLKFGITLERYNEILMNQNGVCKICKSGPTGRFTVLAVDHDHSTGAIRGLLCTRCNLRLGWFEKFKVEALAYING
jgi:hypothetical protein